MKTSYRVKETSTIPAKIDVKRVAQTQATAAAKAIEEAIATNPHHAKSGRQLWVRTGKLKTTIDAVPVGETVAVVAPAGYLEDDDLFQRLLETVPVVADPFRDRDVERAFDKSVDDALKLKPKLPGAR